MTLEEYLAIPEEAPFAEYSDGHMRPKAMADHDHGGTVVQLCYLLHSLYRIERRYHVLPSLRFVSYADRRAYLPDISVIRGSVPHVDPQTAPPWVAIEVLSPSDRATDILEKLDYYLTIGVRAVWIVDTDHRLITVHRNDAPMLALRGNDTVSGGDILPGFETTVAEIFSVLDPPEPSLSPTSE